MLQQSHWPSYTMLTIGVHFLFQFMYYTSTYYATVWLFVQTHTHTHSAGASVGNDSVLHTHTQAHTDRL